MAKFGRKDKNKMPGVNTSSLPDIVFMVLFFFMVTTSMRTTEIKVTVRLPEASEAVKLDRKDLTSYIYIGTPILSMQAQYGNDVQIQLNDSYKTVSDIGDFIASARESMSESDRQLMTTALRVDEYARMGTVTDVKQELRRCYALKILYSARRVQ